MSWGDCGVAATASLAAVRRHILVLKNLRVVRLNAADLYWQNVFRLIKSRRMRWPGNVTRMADRRGTCWVLIGTPEGKRPLGKPRCRWEDDIEMDL